MLCYAEVWLASREATVRLSLTVTSASPVTVTSVSAHLITGLAGPALTPASLSVGEGGFVASHSLEQQLDSEGDTAVLFVLAATSSGATLWPLA